MFPPDIHNTVRLSGISGKISPRLATTTFWSSQTSAPVTGVLGAPYERAQTC